MYACKDCGETVPTYGAALRHSKSEWGINPFTGSPIRHRLELVTTDTQSIHSVPTKEN